MSDNVPAEQVPPEPGVKELVRFYRAQVDKDEQVACSATQHRWRVDRWTNDHDREFLVVADEDAGAPAFALKSEADGEHIVRHDPARVLRAVRSARRLIAELDKAIEFYARPENRGIPAGEVTGLYQAVKLRAEEYDDRPGYLEEWRP
jgi:hypothetical protein